MSKENENINSILERPEDQFTERKSAKVNPQRLAQVIAGFANANGGNIIVGIEDDGTVTGFNSHEENKMYEYMNLGITCFANTPVITRDQIIEVKNYKGEDDHVVLIRVEPSLNKVIATNDGKVYLRQGDKTPSMNHDQILALEYDRGSRWFEDEVVENSSLEDIDEEIIDKYRKRMKVNKPTEEILNARGMLKNGLITNAGIILFGKQPDKFLPQARVRFIRYSGVEAGSGRSLNIIKENTFTGGLPKIIQELSAFVKTQLRDFQYLDQSGEFRVMPEYPEFAWFEGIVNAVTHRDYSLRGDHIKFFMYEDRIEIESPGKLPNIVNLENIYKTRYSRNPRIARVLSDFGWVKELNEGVKRIYSEMERFFLNAPVYSEPGNKVNLKLENNIINRNLRVYDRLKANISERIFAELSTNEKRALEVVSIKGSLQPKDLAPIIGSSNVTAASILRGLHEKELLNWHGNNKHDPTQYYTLSDVF